MSENQQHSHLIGLTTDIVTSYVSNNSVPMDQLGQFIDVVYTTLSELNNSNNSSPQVLVPAIPIKKSVTYDYIICLEDGKKFKSIKRHLKTAYNMTPEEYKTKWNLPSDYPMVAPSYSEKRSQLANSMGLGKSSKFLWQKIASHE